MSNYSLSPLAENPSLASDALCAARSCRPGGMRWLVVSALQGVPALHDLYQVGCLSCFRVSCPWAWPVQLAGAGCGEQ